MKLKSKKSALLLSFTSLLICFAMLAGSTFAWFTDTATTGVNKIQSGTLDVGLEMAIAWDNEGNPTDWASAEGKTLTFKTADNRVADKIFWEPNCTYKLPELRVVNNGNLALKYKVVITGIQGDAKLNEVIKWEINGNDINLTEEHLPAGTANSPTYSEPITITGHMLETANNDYQNLFIDGIGITVYATQYNYENDSTGPDYDKDATYYPVLDAAGLKDALVNGGNIKVDSSFDAGEDTLAVEKNTVLDMNGKTISNEKDIWDDDTKTDWSLLSARNGANLTITGNGTFKAKENDVYAVDVQDGSTVTIEDGTFIGNIHAVYVYEGTANINGGFYAVQQKYTDAAKADGFVLNCYDANRTNGTAKIIVTGGTFVNFNPADCWAEGKHTNFVADGYSVISETKENGDKWYTVVKGKGASSEGELNTIISSATEPTTITLTAGTYELPSLENKDITIKGTKDTVIDMKGEDGTGVVNKAASASFEGVTVEFANENYKGFQHTGKLTYKDCTIKGLQFLYADEVEFINCKFVQDTDAYNVWTYGAGKVLFKDCEFECKGKAVLIYNEGRINGQTVEFQNCKFTASAPVTGKAAIEIDSSLLPDGGTYKVIIDQSTADNVTGFAAGSVSHNTVWNNKKGAKATVIVNGETVLAAE